MRGRVHVVVGRHNMDREQFWKCVFGKCGIIPSKQQEKNLKDALRSHEKKQKSQVPIDRTAEIKGLNFHGLSKKGKKKERAEIKSEKEKMERE